MSQIEKELAQLQAENKVLKTKLGIPKFLSEIIKEQQEIKKKWQTK